MYKQLLMSAFIVTTLIACGGGGGDDSTPSNGNGGGGTTTPTNNNPTLSVSETTVTLNENTSQTLTITTADSVTVSVSDDSAAFDGTISDNTLTLTANDVSADTTGTMTLTATDGKGGSASLTLNVTVIEASPSVSVAQPSYSFAEQSTQRIALTLADPQDDIETIEASTDSSILTVGFDSQTQEVIIETSEVTQDTGNQVVTVRVTDATGNTAETQFTVTVIETSPSVSFEQPAYTFAEQSTQRIALILTDPQDDIETVEVSTDSSILTVSYDSQTQEVIIETGDITQDTGDQVITARVTDATGNTADAQTTVFVYYIPNPPTISINTESGTADYVALKRSQLVIPFSANSSDTPNEELRYEVEITEPNPIGSKSYTFEYDVDVENQWLTIQMPNTDSIRHDYVATLTVIDGNEQSAAAPFTFAVILDATTIPSMTFGNRPSIVFEGQSYVLNYKLTGYEREYFDFLEFRNSLDAEHDVFEWVEYSLDEANQLLTLTIKDGAAGKDMTLWADFTFYEDRRLTGSFPIDIKARAAWNEHQQALSEKLVVFKRHMAQSMELERAAEFMLQALLLNGTIDQPTHAARLEALANLEGRKLNVLGANQLYNYFDSTLQLSEYFADPIEANNAIAQIESNILGLETTGVYVLPIVNQYAQELGMGDTLVMDDARYTFISDTQVSRFIGHPQYGQYTNGQWQFYPAYNWLDAVARQTYNQSL
jgi:hypothetical protein